LLLRLSQMAILYAHLSRSDQPEFEKIARAMTHHPDLIAGNGYFDTELIIFDQLYNSLSIEEFTLFMMEETNLWDTEDLIYFNDLYENTNEYEVSL